MQSSVLKATREGVILIESLTLGDCVELAGECYEFFEIVDGEGLAREVDESFIFELVQYGCHGLTRSSREVSNLLVGK